jgi:hypothetical protein
MSFPLSMLMLTVPFVPNVVSRDPSGLKRVTPNFARRPKAEIAPTAEK